MSREDTSLFDPTPPEKEFSLFGQDVLHDPVHLLWPTIKKELNRLDEAVKTENGRLLDQLFGPPESTNANYAEKGGE